MSDNHFPKDEPAGVSGVSRRGFIAASASTAVAGVAHVAQAQTDVAKRTDPRVPVTVAFEINGNRHKLTVDTRMTLLDALRESVGLTGAKKGCDHGQCGACTVLVDGKRVLSCLSLAVMTDGRSVTTIEGLAARDGTLHPMQQAFIDHDAFQCGYCTPGQIMSAVALVKDGGAHDEAAIREAMSGNICRCAAYPNIVAAIVQAKTTMGA